MDGKSFNEKFSSFLIKYKVKDVPLAKKIIVTIVGFTVLILGVIMIVTPGPAVVVIPAGLTILASEYSWARRWLNKLKALGENVVYQAKVAQRKTPLQRWFGEIKDFTSVFVKSVKKRFLK